VNVAYTAPSQTRLALIVNRDIQYSFEVEMPYYVQTGWTASLTKRISGRWDVQVLGGREHLAYRSAVPAIVAAHNDRVDRIGGGVGYQLGDDTRISLDVYSLQRQSEIVGRDYKTIRAGVSVMYGF
jgi:hypothetical protein